MASPLRTLVLPPKDLFKIIASIIEEHGVEMVVIGLPLTLEGAVGPQGKKVETFSQKLANTVTIPIKTWDERFSSVSAERLLSEMGAKKKDRRTGQTDMLAATIILQSYLDTLKRSYD